MPRKYDHPSTTVFGRNKMNFFTAILVVCFVFLHPETCSGFIAAPPAKGLTFKLHRAVVPTKIIVKLSADAQEEKAEPPSSGSSEDDDTNEIQNIVGLTDKELDRIVSRVPEVREIRADAALDCSTNLKSRLSLSDVEFKKKIVLRLPQSLGYDFGSEIEPSLDLLKDELKLSEEELRGLVLKCPQIIGLDYSSEVKPSIDSIVREVGGDAAAARTMILGKPASLNLPVRGGVTRSGA